MATNTSTTPHPANEASCASPSTRQFAAVLAALQQVNRHELALENIEGGCAAEMDLWLFEAEMARDALTDALLGMHLIVVCAVNDMPLHRMAVLIDEIVTRPGTRAADKLVASLRGSFECDFLLTETGPLTAHMNRLLRRARNLLLSMAGYDDIERANMRHARGGSGNLNSRDKWIFRAMAA